MEKVTCACASVGGRETDIELGLVESGKEGIE